jgi:molybdopterin converting factor small subunit
MQPAANASASKSHAVSAGVLEATARGGTGSLRIALFAGLAERAGSRRIELAWAGGSVADLRAALAAACPAAADLLARSAIAVGDRLAADTDPVSVGAYVAILPPVSGG